MTTGVAEGMTDEHRTLLGIANFSVKEERIAQENVST
jgi:hypothetical protein